MNQALITATTVTLNGQTAPIYGGVFAGALNPAQQLALRLRHQRVNEGSGRRAANGSGVGL